MRCAYHPVNHAVVQCQACGRRLCARCDHRIKGFAYCQDCIVRGVEMLHSAARYAARSGRSKHSPFWAVVAALLPGLGAAYNDQNAKAFFHFIVICGLLQLAEMSGFPFFGLGGIVFYLYSIIDAFRTARAIRAGMDPSDEDERLRRFLRDNVRTWGGVLVGLGLLFLLTDVFQFSSPSVFMLVWPFLLIGIGLFMLIRHLWVEGKEPEPEAPSTGLRIISPSLFSPVSGQLPDSAKPEGSSSLVNYPDKRGRSGR